MPTLNLKTKLIKAFGKHFLYVFTDKYCYQKWKEYCAVTRTNYYSAERTQPSKLQSTVKCGREGAATKRFLLSLQKLEHAVKVDAPDVQTSQRVVRSG